MRSANWEQKWGCPSLLRRWILLLHSEPFFDDYPGALVGSAFVPPAT